MQNEEIKKLQSQINTESAIIQRIKSEMSNVISGQGLLIDRLLVAMLANGHVLLEGVPGLAKTLAVRTLAQCLNGSFSRLQFTPDLLPADLIGTRIYNASTHEFSTKIGPVFANIVLADEINRAPAKVQSALLEAMQERQITIAGETHKLPNPFLVLATQNPIEQEGTYPLPEAQLDRFLFKLHVDYPERAEELSVIRRMAHPEVEVFANQVTDLKDIEKARKLVDQVYLDDKILEYILDLVVATRPKYYRQLSARQGDAHLDKFKSLISFGASPRAGIALALAARAAAFIDGRAYVVPQDIKNVAADVLRHRIILSYEAEAEDVDADMVVSMLLDELKTP